MQPITDQAISRYLTEAKRRLARNTIDHTRPLLRRVAAGHGGDLFAITGDDLDAWLDGAHVSARTRNVYISTLSAFYRWAMHKGITTTNPAVDATRLKAPRALPRPTRADDLALALDAADPRMRAWLCLMAYGGLRCCEVAGLEVEDLLWHLDPPMMHLAHGTKGGHERTVPIAPWIADALRGFGLPRTGPVFRRQGTIQPVSASYVSQRTRRHLAELGIMSTPHKLRHYFGSTFYADSTGDLRATQELMGHASPATTAVYAAWSPGKAAAVIQAWGPQAG